MSPRLPIGVPTTDSVAVTVGRLFSTADFDRVAEGFAQELAQLPVSRASSWRTRSRETPNSSPSCCRVIGSSATRRLSKMAMSLPLERLAELVEPLADYLAELGAFAMVVGARRGRGQQLHARGRLAVALADRGVERGIAARQAAVHLHHVLLLDVKRLAISACVGSMPIAESFAFSLFRLKNSFRCAWVVPILTMRQLFRMKRSMYARIHHAA